MRPRAAIVMLVPIALVLASCGDDDDSDGSAAAVDPVVAGEPFPADRCEANKAAGTISYLSGFDFAAAASIIEVLIADERGYYDDLCLDVKLTPSFSTTNLPLVASNQAQFSSAGSFAELVSFADANDSDLVGFYEHDVHLGHAKPSERGGRHPARCASTDDDDPALT